MQNTISQFGQQFTAMDFGPVALLEPEKALAVDLHMVIVEMIKSLPAPVQTDALLGMAGHLGLPVNAQFNFFQGFYPPAWTILTWLEHSLPGARALSPAEKNNFATVHATAMLLHLLDDHLNDNDLPATHLNLLIRSQLWVFMNRALDDIGHADASARLIAQRFIDEYYASIGHNDGVDSLETYGAHFTQQMAMGFIAPVLMSRRLGGSDLLMADVKSCYGAFGRAWRLLDDLKDMVDDMATDTKSAVYFCLPQTARRFWHAIRRTSCREKDEAMRCVIESIQDQNAIERIVSMICRELHMAATMAESLAMGRYADELRGLAVPLQAQPGSE